jgi:hypothetical protein
VRIAIVVGFFALVILLAAGLKRDPRVVPSPLIDKPAPAFVRAWQLSAHKDIQGKVWLLNVWASWCVTATSTGAGRFRAHQARPAHRPELQDQRR